MLINLKAKLEKSSNSSLSRLRHIKISIFLLSAIGLRFKATPLQIYETEGTEFCRILDEKSALESSWEMVLINLKARNPVVVEGEPSAVATKLH